MEGHQFLVSRRRGYDPAEVDAVIARLVGTLRRYEEREDALRDESTRRSNLQVVREARGDEETSREMVEEELAQARGTLESAGREAAEELAHAEEEAARIIELARADAADLLSRRNARAEALITSALAEVKALRSRVVNETNDYRAGKKNEASALVRAAQLQADQMVEDARHEAGSILGRARREQMMLEQRIGQLRSAVAGIESQFRNLAETALEQTEVMSTMLSLETDELGDVLEEASADPTGSDNQPEVVGLSQGGLTIDLTTDSEEKPPAPEPADEHFAVVPGSTIYQRRGGGLRRRLEEEEVEELPRRSD
jgi:DivIVA domain-containing protein